VKPLDVSGYTLHHFDLTILDYNGDELPNNSWVSGVVMSGTGGCSNFGFDGDYANPGTNIVYTAAFGNDCLIAASANPGADEFIAIAEQVDLSFFSSNQTLSGTAGTPVSVTPDYSGTYAMLMLETPYGAQLEVWQGVVPSSPALITIYNPHNYKGIWGQMVIDPSPPDWDKMYVSTSPIDSIGSSVVLPTLNTALGPTEGYPPGYSISYSEGTLSYGAVSGAIGYMIWINEQASGPGEAICLASISTPNTSVTLPSWLSAELSGETFDVRLMAADGVSASDILTHISTINSPWPPEYQGAYALREGGQGPGQGYEQTIIF
jgi:hypothetical protein